MSEEKKLTPEEQAQKELEREKRRKEREERRALREAQKNEEASNDAAPETKDDQELERERRRQEREQRRAQREASQEVSSEEPSEPAKKERKPLDPDKKKAIIKVSLLVLLMVVVAIIVLLAHNITYRYVKKPGIFDDILGKGYTQKLVLEEAVGEITIKKEETKGDLAKGFIYSGSNTHNFEAAGGTVGIQLVISDEGKILGYAFSRYDHSPGNFQEKVKNYLNSFIGTNLSDLETTHAGLSATWAGATETSVNTVYPILQAIKEVASK